MPFHATLIGVRKRPWGSNPTDSPLEAQLQQKGLFNDLIPLAAQADLVVLTCSVTDETRGMVNENFLHACKPGVRIINVARGQMFNLINKLCVRFLLFMTDVNGIACSSQHAIYHVEQM